MRKKLDSENLGIILLNAFMDEFFPKEESSTPDMFPLYHYNGLPHSNPQGRVIMLIIIVYSVFIYNSLLDTISSWFSDFIGIRFKVNMRIKSNADVSSNQVAKYRSELVR